MASSLSINKDKLPSGKRRSQVHTCCDVARRWGAEGGGGRRGGGDPMDLPPPGRGPDEAQVLGRDM